ncbi:Hypothetical protein in type-1 retrotransposable element R1DM, partial [Stegodyphus mimosarum]
MRRSQGCPNGKLIVRNLRIICWKKYENSKVATNKSRRPFIIRDEDNTIASNIEERYKNIIKETLNIDDADKEDAVENINFLQANEREPDFTYEEIYEIIAKMRDRSAPGLDRISSKFVKCLFNKYPSFFVILYNKCMQLHVFPENWKVGRLVLLPKGENRFRPICLLKVFAKVFDKLIANRLSYAVENEKLIADCQYGFRKGRSADLALYNVITTIRDLKKVEHVALVSFDVRAAFDSVKWSSVLNKISKLNITKNLFLTVRDYFRNRKVIFTGISEQMYVEQQIYKGCPQGSCSAPLFWALTVNTLLAEFNIPNARIVCYADDILIIINGVSLEKIQETFVGVERKLTDW